MCETGYMVQHEMKVQGFLLNLSHRDLLVLSQLGLLQTQGPCGKVQSIKSVLILQVNPCNLEAFLTHAFDYKAESYLANPS
jgi:hypothetical protein